MTKSEHETRLIKLNKLKEAGVDPFPTKTWDNRQDILAIRSFAVNKLTKPETRNEKKQTAVGRIRSIRGQGGLIFIDLQDGTGKIQALFKKNILDKEFKKFQEFIDIGDFVQVNGPLFITKKGELTIEVKRWEILVKSVKPLPEKWHGLEDMEKRFRERYLDMLANPEVRERLIARGRILEIIRKLLIDRGFIEVETPSLQPIYGGGFARPFITHHNALDIDLYLRISSEMYLKRLIAGGIDKVFEFCRIYRNEGINLTHNPEFTMLEAQAAWVDYTYIMDLTEEIFERVALEIFGKTKITYQKRQIDLKRPWKKVTVASSVKSVTGIDYDKLNNVEEARKKAIRVGVENKDAQAAHSIGEIIGLIFEKRVEETLIEPTIACEYPIEISPLAKTCPDDSRFVQRFEPFILGCEYGNNYTELNDPVELNKRFIEEKKREKAGFAEAHQTDWDYLKMIEHGMPPNSGLGIGIDRLAMLFTDTNSIKEVIGFPTLRPLKTLNPKHEILNKS